MAETPSRIEPCFFEDAIPHSLADLAIEIQQEASGLGRGLHADAAAELSDLVRIINSYYSNLIEGHSNRPKDIERALAGAELEAERRPLALEAKAHVIVQRRIDEMQAAGTLPSPTSKGFVAWIHRDFYQKMPGEFRFMKRLNGEMVEIVPGEFRKAPADEVIVGRHYPPSSDRIDAFMDYFAKRYGAAERWPSTRIIAIASAHHRLNYIHPFPDGNGRVSRLMSHAMVQRAGIGGYGLWSISRGLARGLKDRGEYHRMMDHADSPRQGDLDGRGNLSAKALKEYSEWFLSVVLDQIRFSTFMFDIPRLEARYRSLVRDVLDDKLAPDLVGRVLKHGSIEWKEVYSALHTSERTARNTLASLVRVGFLKSSSPKIPVRIAFPLDYRERLFPNLFGR